MAFGTGVRAADDSVDGTMATVVVHYDVDGSHGPRGQCNGARRFSSSIKV